MWTSIHADKRSTLRKRAKTHLSVYWRSITRDLSAAYHLGLGDIFYMYAYEYTTMTLACFFFWPFSFLSVPVGQFHIHSLCQKSLQRTFW